MASLRFKIARWYLQRNSRSEVGRSVAERRAAAEQLAAAAPKRKGARAEPVNAGGVPAEWIETPGAAADRAILYLHGGYYLLGSIRMHRAFTGHLAHATGARMLLIEYRLAPEHPFPAALEDALTAYRWLLGQGFSAERLVVAGDSAGGGLALATLLAARAAALPLPAAAVCLCPWTDLACTGESMNKKPAQPFIVEPEVARISAQLYLAGADPRNPLASPLYADLRGLPPLLLQAGGDDTLLDDATRLADRARLAGVAVELQVWPEMVHEWQQFADIVPESKRAIADIGAFVRRHTGG